MNAIFLLSLFFSHPPGPSTCAARGTPMFEIRERADMQLSTSTTKVYASGAWTFTPVDKDGRVGRTSRGCFDQRTLSSIRKAVQRAPWTITHPKIMCFAYSPRFTQYVLNGRVMFTQRMCGGEQADDQTKLALDFVEQRLAKVLPARSDEPLF